MIKDLISFINKGTPRGVRARKNIIASVLIKGLSVLISLALVPLIIRYLDTTRYGIWITLTYMVSWLGLFDIGLGHGLRNRLAEALAHGDKLLARSYLSTTYALLMMIITFIYFIFLPLYHFINWGELLNAPVEMQQEVASLVLIVFTLFCVQFIVRLIGMVLTADQHPAINSLINAGGNLLTLLGVLGLLFFSQRSLIRLGTTYSVLTLIVPLSASILLFRTKYKHLSPAPRFVNFRHTPALMGIGWKFFVIQITTIIVFSTDQIIITRLFGPKEVTPYHVAFKYFNILVVGFGILTGPYWSAFTEAWVKKDIQWIKNTTRNLLRIWFSVVLIAVLMLLLSTPVYRIWVGEKVKISFYLSAVMAAFTLISTWNMIFVNFINGVSKIRIQLIIAIFAGVINIPVSVYLARDLSLGIAGVMLGTCLSLLPDIFITPIQYFKIIQGKAKGIWNR